MALRHYQGGDRPIVEVDTPLVPGVNLDTHFVAWLSARTPEYRADLSPAVTLKLQDAFLAGRASVQQAPEQPAVSSFRPPSLDNVQLLAIRDVEVSEDTITPLDPLDHNPRASRTLVAALAYFADMVLQSGAGGEELLSYQEAQNLLQQLTKHE